MGFNSGFKGLNLTSVTLKNKTERLQYSLCMQIRLCNKTLFNLGSDAGKYVVGQTIVALKSHNS